MSQITPAEIKVGDLFYCPPNRHRSSIGGTISKVLKVSFQYTTVYEPCPGTSQVMTLTTRKDELIGGRLKRPGGAVFEIGEKS